MKVNFKCPSHGDLKRWCLFQLLNLNIQSMYLKFRSQNFTIIITWKFGPEWVPKKVGPSLDSGSEMILAQKSVQLPYSFQAHCPEPRASLGCVFTLLPCLFWNLSWIVMDTRQRGFLLGLAGVTALLLWLMCCFEWTPRRPYSLGRSSSSLCISWDL